MCCAEREHAAKRLAALARSSEAVESAAQVPLAQLSTLSSLAARSTLSTRCSCAINHCCITLIACLLCFCSSGDHYRTSATMTAHSGSKHPRMNLMSHPLVLCSSHIHSNKTDSLEDETTGAGAEQRFTASDLATLKVCTRSNGKRWTLGDGRGSAGEVGPFLQSVLPTDGAYVSRILFSHTVGI